MRSEGDTREELEDESVKDPICQSHRQTWERCDSVTQKVTEDLNPGHTRLLA